MLFIILLFYSFFSIAASQCPSGVKFVKQPPQFLHCSPPTTAISLLCEIQGASGADIVWHYFGLNSNSSIVVNTSEPLSPYTIQKAQIGDTSSLSFIIRPLTYGVYWCTVKGYTTPSMATLICPSTLNTSLNVCMSPLAVEAKLCVNNNETSSYSYANISDIFDQCESLPVLSSSTVTLSSTTTAAFYSTSTQQLHTTVISSSSISSNVMATSSSPDAPFRPTMATPTGRMDTTTVSSLPRSSAMSTSPLSRESNSSPSETNAGPNPILIVLTIVCVLLGCVATLIIAAIVVLCCLTKRGKYVTSKEDEGSIPPTVDPIRYTDNIREADGVSQSTCTTTCTNGSPPLQPPEETGDHPVSFSNPVYEMAVPTVAPPITTSRLSLSPPKHLPPPSFSLTPPIFSEDKSDEKRRSYYTKPDLSKKRSHSITAQEISQPPEPQSPSASETEVMYDTPILKTTEPPSDTDNIYSSPKRTIAAQKKPMATSDPNYDAPWEKLPIAIQRSRESTRSHSRQRDSSAQPTINNNNKTATLFDDPAYDIPSV